MIHLLLGVVKVRSSFSLASTFTTMEIVNKLENNWQRWVVEEVAIVCGLSRPRRRL